MSETKSQSSCNIVCNMNPENIELPLEVVASSSLAAPRPQSPSINQQIPPADGRTASIQQAISTININSDHFVQVAANRQQYYRIIIHTDKRPFANP
jgi:hypothetical protein